MVTLPKEFVATRWDGYFFNTKDEQLYSLKIDGMLKPLKFRTPNPFNHIGRFMVKLTNGSRVKCTGGFNVSVKGQKKFYPLEQLKELKEHDAIFPVKETV